MNPEAKEGSLKKYYALLFAVWAFHALNNAYYLLTTDPPPNYDCGYHLQLSLNVYDRLLDFESDNYWFGVLTSSGFYPFFAYLAAFPFYLVFGFSQDAAIAGNLLFLAGLLWATFEIGRQLKDPSTGLLSATLLSFFPFVFGISRNYYIETGLMAVTAFSILCLLRTRNFSNRNWSLAFGLSVGLGMMTKWSFAFHLVFPVVLVLGLATWEVLREKWETRSTPHILGSIPLAFGVGLLATAISSARFPLWGGPGILFSILGIALLVRYRVLRTRLLNLAGSGFVAVLVCYPWYIHYWDHVSGTAAPFLDPEVTRQASPFTAAAFLYYPFVLESNQLGPALFLVFLLALLFFPWRRFHRFGLLGAWLFGSYLITSNIPYKDPRYIAPFLPAVALFMGIALLSIPWRKIRYAILSLVAAAAVWQFGMMTFEWPLPASNHWRLGPHGYTYSFWNHGVYGTGRDRKEKWPHREIVSDFKAEVLTNEDPEREPVLRCLMDYHGIHQGVFEFVAKAERAEWRSVFDRVTYRLDFELNRWAESEAVLFPQAPLNGDLYRMRDQRHPFEFNQSPNSFLQIRFPDQREYRVPSGETLILAFRDPSRVLHEDRSSTFQFGNRLEILSGRIEKHRNGEGWLLRLPTEWRYLHNDNWPAEEYARIWIDLYTPEGEWVASNDFQLEPGFETDQETSRTLVWEIPNSYNGQILQVGIGVGSEDREDRVPIEPRGEGEDLPNLFFNRLVYLGE